MKVFTPFPKIARLNREITITEKLDGTNAQICIEPGIKDAPMSIYSWFDEATQTDMVMYAGSRTRWITPEQDNQGFARWAKENAQELTKLGEGSHFGEWWGQGIQRKYNLTTKRFSLFNVARWNSETLPTCCNVVPTLYVGTFSEEQIKAQLTKLATDGSVAAPGFPQPEGIVIWHEASRTLYKVTILGDEKPKGQTE